MSLRLRLLDPLLRVVVKRKLAGAKTPQAARRGMERAVARLPGTPVKARFTHESIDGPGGPIPVEWVSYGRAARRRIVLYLHGGAYIMGSPRTHRFITAALARATGARIMVPDYRLAPEHPFPAALEDAVAAYAALIGTGYSPSRIALAGESAGGGLCFALLQRLIAAGYPPPACIATFSPWTDLTLSGESMGRNEKRDAMLPLAKAAEAAGFYIGSGDAGDPLISPLFGSYAGAPPVLIHASRAEILLDDATRMTEKLREQGVYTELKLWSDTPHACAFFAPFLPEATESVSLAADFITKAWDDPQALTASSRALS